MNGNQKYFFDFNLWYKNLLIIHLVIIGASVVMSIGSLIMMDISKIQFSNPENRPIILSMAGLVIVFFLAARYIYHRGVNGIIKAGRNKKQSEKLYGIYIARLALIEAGALISLVLFFVYADWTLFIYAVLLIMYMILQLPQKRFLKKLLHLH